MKADMLAMLKPKLEGTQAKQGPVNNFPKNQFGQALKVSMLGGKVNSTQSKEELPSGVAEALDGFMKDLLELLVELKGKNEEDEMDLSAMEQLVSSLEQLLAQIQPALGENDGLVEDGLLIFPQSMVMNEMGFEKSSTEEAQIKLNNLIEQLVSKLPQSQFLDLSKQLAQLKELMIQDESIQVDSKLLSLLKAVEERSASPVKTEEKALVALTGKQPSTSSGKESEQAKAEPASTSGKSLLLRTDTDKILWQNPMDKVQQHAIFTQTKGAALDGDHLMKQLESLIQSSQLNKGLGMNKLVIKLFPENLGSVRIEILQNQESLVARLHVENQQVKQLIEANLHSLKAALHNQQVQVEKFEVTSNLDFEQFKRQFDPNNQDQRNKGQEQGANQEQDNEGFETGSFLEELENLLKKGGEIHDTRN